MNWPIFIIGMKTQEGQKILIGVNNINAFEQIEKYPDGTLKYKIYMNNGDIYYTYYDLYKFCIL